MEHLTKDQINSLILNPTHREAEWMDHIKECEACRLEYEGELAIQQSLGNLSYHQPSVRFAKNIIESLEKRKKAILANSFWTRFTVGSIVFATVQAWMMLMYLIVQMQAELSLDLDGYWLQNISGWSVSLTGSMVSLWLLYIFDRWMGRKKLT